MGTEGGSPGAGLVRARLDRRPPKPAVAELVIRRGLSHLLRVGWEGLVCLSIVQLLTVHVAVGPHGASLDGAVNSEGKMP